MSFFHDTFKVFCKSIAVILGIFIGIIPVIFFIALATSSNECYRPKTVYTCLPNLEGSKSAPSGPAILRINIEGVIGDGIDYQSVENQLIESRLGPLKNNKVKGILLYLNTPGGTINDSDVIYRLLLAYKKKYNVPVYAYVQGLCASGGVYISCAADRIYASPVSIIGSVGVVLGPFFNVKNTLDKVGVQSRILTEGKNKDMMNPFRQWKEGEDRFLKSLNAYFYDRFVSLVSQARPKLNKDVLIEHYGAGIFDSPKAQELGYIDVGDSSYQEAVTDLLQAANIDPDKPYQIVELVPKKKWLSEFLSKSPLFTGKIKHEWDTGRRYDPFFYQFQP